MGDKLKKYYELVEAKGGLKAKMRMAMKTNVPSNKAGEAEDSPDVLAKAYEIAKEILGADAPKL